MTRRFLFRAMTLALAIFLFGSDAPSLRLKSVYAQSQYSVVLKLIRAREYQQAFAECERLLEAAPLSINGYQRFAEIAHETDRVTEATAFLQRLSGGTPEQQALKHYGLAALYVLKLSPDRGDRQFVLEHCQQALSFSPNLTKAYLLMVDAQLGLQQEAELQKYLEAALAKGPQNISAQISLGYFYRQKERFDEGLAAYDKALRMAPNSLDAMYGKLNLLIAKQNETAYQAALTLGQQLLLAAQQQDVIEQQIKAQRMLGYAQNGLNNRTQAISEFRAGLQLAESAGELTLQDALLTSLCSNYTSLDDYANVLTACGQGLAISSTRYKEYHLGNLGYAYRRLGDTPMGIGYYEQSLSVAREKKCQDCQIWMLTNLGEAYADADPPAYDKSQRLLDEAVQLAVVPKYRSRRSSALASLGKLYYEKGEYQKALAYQREAYDLACAAKHQEQQARSLNSLGAAYAKLKDWPNSLRSYQTAQKLGEELNLARAVWLAHGGLAANYRELGQFAEAESHYQLAIQSQETMRGKLKEDGDKVGFWQDKVKLYKDLISLLRRPVARSRATGKQAPVARNPAVDAQAFHLAEQWHARAFLDLLSEAHTRSVSGELNNVIQQPLGLSAVQKLLDDQTVVLSYSLDQPVSLLFGVSRNQFEVYNLPSETDINDCAAKLLKSLLDKTQSSPHTYQLEAHALYQKLVAPVRSLLAGKKHLIIVPDGALQRLPFEVLLKGPTKNTRTSDLADLPYLIKDFAISYTPSVSIWARLHEMIAKNTTKAPKDFIAFGNPQYAPQTEGSFASLLGGATLQPLKYSQSEVERISALFGKKGSVTVYQGAHANEATVKSVASLNQYRFVHFSVHASVNEAIPRLSGLLLSPSFGRDADASILSQNDGVLTAEEIMRLRLNAELVSLSACETGLGKLVKGEGLMGLMRAFIYAGTPAVAVSLWKVDDRATADLMESFYKNLLHGKRERDGKQVSLNKAEALREAQLEVIREGNAPYYWAAFVIEGHP